MTVNYDEIGRILLKYCSFQAAESLIEQLQELIANGQHPGAAFQELLAVFGEDAEIFNEEPIKGWVEDVARTETIWELPYVFDPVNRRVSHLYGESVPETLTAHWDREQRVLTEQTEGFWVQAQQSMPSLGPNVKGIVIRSKEWAGLVLQLTRGDAVELMEALAVGLMLMEKLP